MSDPTPPDEPENPPPLEPEVPDEIPAPLREVPEPEVPDEIPPPPWTPPSDDGTGPDDRHEPA